MDQIEAAQVEAESGRALELIQQLVVGGHAVFNDVLMPAVNRRMFGNGGRLDTMAGLAARAAEWLGTMA
ncbi:MAG: hypothetical protein ABI321_14935, partial [Polyangia bacterium]